MKRLISSFLILFSVSAFGADLWFYNESQDAAPSHKVGYEKPLPVQNLDSSGQPVSGFVDGGNSTTTALNNGQTFTGAWKNVEGKDSVVVAVKTDQNGTYTIQFSPDGTNADSTLTRYYRTAQIEPPHRFTITRKYMRVTFTNDSGSNQTYLRLQTTIGDKADLNIPIDATMSQDYDSISVRPTDYTTEVALGRRQGAATWNKFGYNDDVDISTSPEILASWGGTFQFLTSAETITIVSTDVDDDGDPADTGANSIVVYGVDANRDLQTAVYTLNGTTNVVSAETWLGINRVSIYLAGSSKFNEGTITVTATTSGYTLAQMPAQQSTTQQCVFYVPQNYQFLATDLYLNSIKLAGGGGNPEITFKGFVYSAVSNAIYEVYRDVLDTANDNRIKYLTSEPFIIGEKSILYFTATSDKDNTAARCRFSGKLIGDIDR